MMKRVYLLIGAVTAISILSAAPSARAQGLSKQQQQQVQQMQKQQQEQINKLKKQQEADKKKIMEKQEAEKKEAQRKAGQGNAKSSEQAKKEAQKAQNQAEQERKKSIAQQKKKAAEEQKKAEQARIEAEKQRKLAQEHERKAAAHQQKLAERTALLQKREQEHVAEIYKQNLNLKEAEAIKRAYIYITMANAVYDGHRWRAMGHLTEAAKILDTKILKNGTDGQKVLALQQDVEAYKTLFLRKQLGGVYEPQILADMQMLVGYKILTEQVRPILLRRGDQPRVLDLVDSAIGQINQAATYRRTGI